MEIYDIIMLVVLGGATLFGAYKGLAWQLASIASIFASYLVALKFRDPVAQMIKSDPPWNIFLAMLVLYVGTSLVIWIGFRMVKKTIDRLKLRDFDRQFGALFGAAKGVAFCVVITLFAMTLLAEAQKKSVVHSYSGYYIALLLDKSHPIMPKELHDALHPYIHSLDERLDNPTQHHHDPLDPHGFGDGVRSADDRGAQPDGGLFGDPTRRPPPGGDGTGNDVYRTIR